MSSVTCQISISLDGFVAGPNQSLENPLGENGLRLHQWVFGTASWRKLQGEAGGAHTVDLDVVGAQAVQQYLRAGLLDELYLHIAPVVLGAGERLLENVGDPTLEPVDVIASPAGTHVRSRTVRYAADA